MVTIICITGATCRQARRPRRWLLIILAAVLCCGLAVSKNGAEQVDSGWALSAPTPLSTNHTPVDPAQQFMFQQMLEQTHEPLLKAKDKSDSTEDDRPAASPAATPEGSTQNTSPKQGRNGFRIAVKPDGVDGWRPAGPAVNQSQPVTLEHHDAPLLVAPGGAMAKEPPREIECGQEENGSAAPGGRLPPGNGEALEDEQEPEDETPITESDDESADTEPPAEEPAEEPAAEESASILPVETPSKPEPAATPEPGAKAPAAPQIQLKKGEVTTVPLTIPETEEVAPPPLTRQLVNLRGRVRSVLKGYYRKQLNSRDNDPWETMHGMLAYGVQSRIRQGGPRGEPITSVGWLCFNKSCKGQTLMYVTPSGELRAKYGVGLQGHLGQLLAMLAQCHVSAEYPIHIGDKEFTVRDLIEAEKKTCYPKSELTFKLIALQHYLDLNDKWVNDQGLDWDIPRLVREELAQPIRGAACGGTHRLSSLSLTVKARVRRGEPLDGEYARAAEFVKKYHEYAFRLQNRDGSLSTSWFRGRGDEDDLDRRIKTTGHILEWLCYSLSDEELRSPRTISAVTYLANIMYSNYDHEWEVGPVSHATHALLLYDERVFLPFDRPGTVATYRAKPAKGTAVVAKRTTPPDTIRR